MTPAFFFVVSMMFALYHILIILARVVECELGKQYLAGRRWIMPRTTLPRGIQLPLFPITQPEKVCSFRIYYFSRLRFQKWPVLRKDALEVSIVYNNVLGV